jgi:hypothetical protein
MPAPEARCPQRGPPGDGVVKPRVIFSWSIRLFPGLLLATLLIVGAWFAFTHPLKLNASEKRIPKRIPATLDLYESPCRDRRHSDVIYDRDIKKILWVCQDGNVYAVTSR